jgi:nucleoid-associated protein YgaU
MPELQKAEILQVDNTSKKVACQFNPKDFAITRVIKWVTRKSKIDNAPTREFAGGEPQNLTVKLLFDSTDDGSDVRNKYKMLLEMAQIDETKKDTTTQMGEPPICMFQWGNFMSYKGVITQVSQNFTLFKTDGTPLRASVDVTFSETGEQQKKQNPTTRTEARKIWVVHEGQTLDWIAYQEYGDPAYWRHIAETNNLTNPRDLRPGQALKLTPLP